LKNPDRDYPSPDLFIDPVIPIRIIKIRDLTPEQVNAYGKTLAASQTGRNKTMSQAESDVDYRERIRKVCSEEDRTLISTKYGKALDDLGRKYDRYRFGKALFEDKKD
jgi:hypothetical protein